MRIYEKKLLKYKKITVGALISFGLLAAPLTSYAQSSDAWTGAIAGTNIYIGNDDMLKNIKKYLNNNEIDRAVKSAQRYVASFESDARSGKTSRYRYDAYNALCISLAAQKKFDEALEACNTAVKDSPARWFAYNSRGSLNYRSGDFPAAIADYQLALAKVSSRNNFSAIIENNIKLAESKN